MIAEKPWRRKIMTLNFITPFIKNNVDRYDSKQKTKQNWFDLIYVTLLI